jgi:pSer/pThr/pTyr-binding forkhead associated (FHA) protein
MISLTLTVLGKARPLHFEDDVVTIGRSKKCTLVLDDKKVSREHAKLEKTDGVWTITDLGSGNGTKINGGRVEAHVLAMQDVIRIGDAELVVNAIEEDISDDQVHEQKTEFDLKLPDDE